MIERKPLRRSRAIPVSAGLVLALLSTALGVSAAPAQQSSPTPSFQQLFKLYCLTALQQQQDNSTNFPRKRFQFQNLIFCLNVAASKFMTHLNACNPFFPAIQACR